MSAFLKSLATDWRKFLMTLTAMVLVSVMAAYAMATVKTESEITRALEYGIDGITMALLVYVGGNVGDKFAKRPAISAMLGGASGTPEEVPASAETKPTTGTQA